jgi:hypothetical protein
MTDLEEETRNENPMKILGMIIPALPSIIFRCSGEYLRFRSKARKGGYLFQNELMNQGVDKTTALKLTEIYLEGSYLFRYLFALRRLNSPNK